MHTYTRGLKRATVTLIVVVAFASLMAACGSSSSSSSSSSQTSPAKTSSSGAASTSSATSGAAITAKDVQTALAYTGGKASPATGSPIKVGLVVSNVGPVAQPFLASAAKAAAMFVNSKLGGVDGHPISLTQCNFGATAQQGQQCGDQFANNPSVKAVVYTGGTVGVQQMHGANAGRKVYFCDTTSPPDAAVANQFCTNGGPLASGAIATYLAQDLHIKKLAFLTPDVPSLAAVATQQKAVFAKLGIQMTIGLVPASATDVTSAIVASGAQSADAIYLQLPEPGQCIAFVNALKSLALSKPVISLPTCMDASVAAQTGSIPPWTFLQYGPIAQAPDPTGQIAVFDDVANAYKASVGNSQGAFAPQAFGDVLLMTKILTSLAPAT